MIKKLINFLSLFALAVLVVNALFIYPSADDFSYFVKQTDYGFWAFQEWHYFNWGGRYIPNMILGSFDFNGAGLYWYRLIVMAVIIGLYFSLYGFTKRILQPKDAFFTSNLIFLAYCFSLYSLSQEFYWMPGSITYTLSLILCLVCWTILEKSKNPVYFFINVLIIVVLNGTNEISTLFYNGSLLLYLCFQFIQTKKINIPVFMLFVVSVGCMLASILAPGNSVRTLSENNPNTHDLVFSLSRAVFRTGFFLAERLFIFLILGLILFHQLQKRYLKINLTNVPKGILKVLCIIFPFAVLCFGIFPSYYATGRIPPERTVNTIAFFFMIAIIFSIQFYKDTFTTSKKLQWQPIFNYVPLLLVVLLAVYPNDLRSNIYDLFSGRSMEFEKEMRARDEYLKSTPDAVVTVKKISALPNTLLFKDISEDPNTFFNHYFARFYNKKSVSVHE